MQRCISILLACMTSPYRADINWRKRLPTPINRSSIFHVTRVKSGPDAWLTTPFSVACRCCVSISLTVAAAITSHSSSPICTRHNHAAPQTLSLASCTQTNPDKASILRNANLVKNCSPIA